jgi:O-antigen/teichoic acid export membrane protein
MPFLLFFAFENRIDKYLVELNLGLESVGLYSLLIKVFGLLTIALNAFDDGIRPFFYRNLKESKSLVNKYFNLYFGFGILILTVINSIGYNLEYILKNKDYLVIQEYFLIGSIIFIMIIPVRFYGLVLVFYKESKKLSYLAFIKVTIITILMILLIPKFELYGALYALFFSYLVNIIMFSYILYQKINVIPNWKSLIYLSIFMIGSYLTFQQMESGQKLLYSGVYLAVLMGAFIWLYKKEGYAIIKQKI